LSHGSFSKGLTMAVIGLVLGCIGTDETSGKVRFAFGIPSLYDGLDIVPMVVGLFGISEVLLNLESPEQRVIVKTRVRNLLPNREDWRRSALPVARGSVLGFFIGLIPGGGTVLSSFISYALEKKVSKHPEEFGKGAIEGVAGPETANNASVGASFIPLFGLGIPSNVVMAILLASLTIHGVTPGPNFIAQNQELFWAIIISMYIGNVMLLILNLPLIGIWVKLLKIPYRLLFPWILLFCMVGAYSVNSRMSDVLTAIIFGVFGYLLKKLEYEPAPMALGFVLGPMFELSFRQSMSISNGSFGFFVERPVALAALLLCAVILMSTFFGSIKKMRRRVLDDPNWT
ncbi:MAG: tripartite tricarboxylate transporter permease, partial [Lautropia sp.]